MCIRDSRKTAFKLFKVLDSKGSEVSKLPPDVFYPLRSALRIRKEVTRAKSFFEALNRVGKVRLVVLDFEPSAQKVQARPKLVAAPKPNVPDAAKPVVSVETPDCWDDEDEQTNGSQAVATPECWDEGDTTPVSC